MTWISTKEKLPSISYLESDNADDPYECYPVLVYCPESPGVFCVAHLCIIQDESKWNNGDKYWELYIPGEGGSLDNRNFEIFTHWMPLPKSPG